MAAAYSNSWANSTGANPLSITTSPTIHDYLLGGFVHDIANEDACSATGFTSRVNQTTTGDGQTLNIVDKPDASGSEGAISFSTTFAHQMIGFCLAASGVDNTTPRDVAPQVGNNNTAAASPWTIDVSITPVTDGCLIVAIMGSDTTSGVDAVHSFSTTVGSTGAWTVRQDLNGLGAFGNIGVGTCSQTTAGAITVRGTGTKAAASAGRSMAVFALRPAGGGGGAGIIYPQLERGVRGALRGMPGRIARPRTISIPAHLALKARDLSYLRRAA